MTYPLRENGDAVNARRWSQESFPDKLEPAVPP